jgi:hypothetical protein
MRNSRTPQIEKFRNCNEEDSSFSTALLFMKLFSGEFVPTHLEAT